MQTLALEEDPQTWVDTAAAIAARHPTVRAFEVRYETLRSRAASLLDGKTSAANASARSGIGIMLYVDGASAFVNTEEPTRARLHALIERGARLAAASARTSWRQLPPNLDRARVVDVRPRASDPFDASPESIAQLLARSSDAARAAAPDARVASVFGALTRDTWFVDSAGSRVAKRAIVSTLRVGATMRDGGRLGDAAVREAGERGVDDYAQGDLAERLGRDAIAQARDSLRAVPFPSGRYRVLCDGHLSGMLAHESFGHLAEFDLVDSGWSTLRGRQGERLAVEEVSISDAPVSPTDPTHGIAVPVDDQGVRGRKVTMLERGVLRAWMHTRESAAVEGVEPTGNGRALDSQFPSIVRMRNTFFEPGDRTREEALEEMRDGIYLIGARGGAPYSDGSFMFTSHRGYRVENGEITQPVRATSIHGNVLDFLKSVRLLTRDFDVYTNFFGGCGKGVQSLLHVGVGGPHVLVEDALVGGHAA